MIPCGIYCAKTYDDRMKRNGKKNGYRTICFDGSDMTDEEIEEMKSEIRLEMKERNKAYRETRPGPHAVSTLCVDEKLDKISPDLLKLQTSYKIKLDEGTGNTCFLIGSSKAGKSTLLMDIYKRYYTTAITVLYSVNSRIKIYDKVGLIKVNRFGNDKPSDLIKIGKKINSKCDNKYDFCYMFDDIVNVRHSTILNEMILTLRNSRLSSIVSLQFPNLLSKQARGSINNLFFFRLNNDESIEVALKSFLSSRFAKMGVIGLCNQINAYKKLTKNHQFMYYHPASDTLSLHRLDLTKK